MMHPSVASSHLSRHWVRCALMTQLVGGIALHSTPSRADERTTPSSIEPPLLELARADEVSVTTAFVTGAVIAGASLGVGGSLAVGAESDGLKAVGVYGVQAGLVVAPFVAHAMLGEHKRGVYFSLLPTAGMLGMAAVLQARPHTVAGGPAVYQYAFSTLMTVSVFSAMLGVSDVLSFHDRAGKTALAVMPDVHPNRIGIGIGGSW